MSDYISVEKQTAIANWEIHCIVSPSLGNVLVTAVANEYKLDKPETSYNDILDAFRLPLIFYKRSKE